MTAVRLCVGQYTALALAGLYVTIVLMSGLLILSGVM